MKTEVFPILYNGPISYWGSWLQSTHKAMNFEERFVKQTFRNRMQVLNSNGVVAMSIPVEKPLPQQLIKDVRISFAEHWQKDHIRGLKAAYNSSPFFEFYDYLLLPLYEKNEKWLVDFNMKWFEAVHACLELKSNFDRNIDWKNEELINWGRVYQRKILAEVEQKKYRQVFNEEFSPNLSVLDLLFNVGPESRLYLTTVKTHTSF